MDPHFDAYLQHGAGTAGPFKTEKVEVRYNPRASKKSMNPPIASYWEAKVGDCWHRIWINNGQTFIRLRGEEVKVRVDKHDRTPASCWESATA